MWSPRRHRKQATIKFTLELEMAHIIYIIFTIIFHHIIASKPILLVWITIICMNNNYIVIQAYFWYYKLPVSSSWSDYAYKWDTFYGQSTCIHKNMNFNKKCHNCKVMGAWLRASAVQDQQGYHHHTSGKIEGAVLARWLTLTWCTQSANESYYLKKQQPVNQPKAPETDKCNLTFQ